MNSSLETICVGIGRGESSSESIWQRRIHMDDGFDKRAAAPVSVSDSSPKLCYILIFSRSA